MKVISLLLICFVVTVLTGCETAKGFSKDVDNTVHNVASQDGWLMKTDAWMREHMW